MLDAETGFSIDELESTQQIFIPKDPLKRVIGQNEAINLAATCAKQRRHFLLVGPPGTGKSMIAQAMALHLPRPTEEIRIVHNPENPERPLVEMSPKEEVLTERTSRMSAEGELIDPKEVPLNVAERLGYKCIQCGTYSPPKERFCTKCGKGKGTQHVPEGNPFGDLIGGLLDVTMAQMAKKERVTTTRRRFGKEEVVVFEAAGDMVRVLDEKALERRRELQKLRPRKVLVPIDRNPFVLATGASDTELLGDVRHDPYGGHPQLGTAPYERVIPGSIHESHQGVLFIDELPHLGPLQRYILTAMQEKIFPITGRNPQSAGASVKVIDVPCDFIFVGACNIQDLQHVLSPLRSRIVGSGYEVLVETVMEDNETNLALLMQFVAQEIAIDSKIPHADNSAVREYIEESRRRAKLIDGTKGLTLRLRELGGLIRTSGDLAIVDEAELITREHVIRAIKRARSIEEQLKDRYGSYEKGVASDMTSAQKAESPYHYWNYNPYDDKKGYD
ncbi:MAG TPA: Lon protease family protein [Euryarchaeota archaeon]|nr:Lon protease family protein [Euryarchaeota archaeon]